MAFADVLQFSCRKLQGKRPVKALDDEGVLPQLGASGSLGFGGWQAAGVWCI